VTDHPTLPLDLGDIVLRRAVPQDVPAIREYYANPEVARYQLFSVEQLQRLVDVPVEETGTPDLCCLAVVHRDENRVVGDCNLTVVDLESRQGEIAYAVHPDYWGRGIGTRSVRALVDFGFRAMALHRITAGTDARNERSVRLLERIGFRREAHFLRDFLVEGEWVDSYVYALLGSEWPPAPEGAPPLAGTWNIVETGAWEADELHLLGPPRLVLGARGGGSLRMIAVEADVDWRRDERHAGTVEFSFVGDDDGSPICGRGHARLDGDTLRGRLFLHQGDDSDFVAVRAGG